MHPVIKVLMWLYLLGMAGRGTDYLFSSSAPSGYLSPDDVDNITVWAIALLTGVTVCSIGLVKDNFSLLAAGFIISTAIYGALLLVSLPLLFTPPIEDWRISVHLLTHTLSGVVFTIYIKHRQGVAADKANQNNEVAEEP